VLDSEEHRLRARLLEEFRSLPGNQPLFLCKTCSRRFATAHQLALHTKKGLTLS